jgi:hypothetical protein
MSKGNASAERHKGVMGNTSWVREQSLFSSVVKREEEGISPVVSCIAANRQKVGLRADAFMLCSPLHFMRDDERSLEGSRVVDLALGIHRAPLTAMKWVGSIVISSWLFCKWVGHEGVRTPVSNIVRKSPYSNVLFSSNASPWFSACCDRSRCEGPEHPIRGTSFLVLYDTCVICQVILFPVVC